MIVDYYCKERTCQLQCNCWVRQKYSLGSVELIEPAVIIRHWKLKMKINNSCLFILCQKNCGYYFK